MRTTVILNDRLAAEAKRLAAERHTTLSAIINEALRERLNNRRTSQSAVMFRMPVFRGQGPILDSTVTNLSRIGEDDEFPSERR